MRSWKDKTVEECIRQNVLRNFLLQNMTEVKKMMETKRNIALSNRTILVTGAAGRCTGDLCGYR